MHRIGQIARAARGGLVVATASLVACGGGGGSGSVSPQATGTLDVTNCVIAAGASSCQAAISWSAANAVSPRVQVGGATLASTAAGTAQAALGFGPVSVALFDGATRLADRTASGVCASASTWDGTRCQPFAVRLDARAPTPFVESGRAVTLEVVLFRPPGAGPFPAVMFNHGSTGNGDDPSQFSVTYTSEAVARFFAERGWMVAFPQRRGRGASDGLYDEGFTPDRSRYSCVQEPALAGVDRALSDLDAALDYLKSRGDVDASRLIAAGTSRGGILAVAHAGRRPGDYRGAVNFAGGWLGEGCTDAAVVNRATFARGAGFPPDTLWLYGANDSFYSASHSRGNFDGFVAAGGKGSFAIYTRAPGLDGHFIVNDPALWAPELDAYVKEIGG